MKASTKSMRFIDLFAGLGGFHLALQRLGHECVFASEINPELQDVYERNFGLRPAGDIRTIKPTGIPSYDILCAGFPCQPFSKAGEQLGTNCKLWGDLFAGHILRLLRARNRPRFFIFENVANLERHDGGRTWDTMQSQLARCGYSVKARVLSPKSFGIPQIRERLFIVGSLDSLDDFAWPAESEETPSIYDILDNNPPDAKPPSDQIVRCLDTWNEFLQLAPPKIQLPSFPIWTMEFGATYPFKKYDSLHKMPLRTLRNHKGCHGCTLNYRTRKEVFEHLPSYVHASQGAFPRWKQMFIKQNRDFYRANKAWIQPWLHKIRQFPPCYQKLEWNCQGEERDIWKYVIQFRASGVRVKRPTTAPSLVAMTTSQVPIIAWENRYMTPRECCRLQSMEELQVLPHAMTKIYKALGNAVNTKVVEMIVESLLLCGKNQSRQKKKVA